RGFVTKVLAGLILIGILAIIMMVSSPHRIVAHPSEPSRDAAAPPLATAQGTLVAPAEPSRRLKYQPRQPMDTSGFYQALAHLRWPPDASLEAIRENWRTVGARMIEELDKALPPPGKSDSHRLLILLSKAGVFNYEGETNAAYELLEQTRSWVEKHDALA